MHLCHFSQHREGVRRIGRLVVYLSRQCIIYYITYRLCLDRWVESGRVESTGRHKSIGLSPTATIRLLSVIRLGIIHLWVEFVGSLLSLDTLVFPSFQKPRFGLI